MKNTILLASASFSLMAGTTLLAESSIIPQVQKATPAKGSFTLNANTTISFSRSSEQMAFNAQYLRNALSVATGYELKNTPVSTQASQKQNVIRLILKKQLAEQGEGAYKLDVTDQAISIYGGTPQGVFYGIQSLRQLCPVEISSAEKVDQKWDIPAISIEDAPRFQWRGFMLDSCRHIQSMEVIKEYIDLMSFYKLNIFHWHLTEDEAWRMEIKKYPKLTEIGANPGTGAEGEELNGYYTQEQMKEIVRYANDRHIKVVPEFDIPGHTNALLIAYPEYDSNPKDPIVAGKRDMRAFSSKSGRRAIDPSNPKTLPFVMDIYDEMAEIFTDGIIHIGGDERPKGEWEKSESIQALKKKLRLKSESDVQNWLLNEVSEKLRKKGVRSMAWAEHIHGGVPENQIVHAWRGSEAINGAKAGREVVNSTNPSLYLDYPANGAELDKHDKWMHGCRVSASKIFHYNIIPQELNDEQKKLIIGVEAPLWTETIKMDRLDNKVFPRLIALSETAWVDHKDKNWQSFQKRFAWHEKFMELKGINYDKTDKIK